MSNMSAKGKHLPDFDIVECDADGEPIKETNPETGKKFSKQIGAVWMKEGAKAGLIRFEDGTVAKLFRRPPSKEAGSAAPAEAAPAKQSQPQSKFGGGAKSRFSKS